MKYPKRLSILMACCLAAAFSGAQAQETSDGAATSTVGTSSTTEAQLAAEFAGFLGGKEQAGAVVSGLRQGTAFDLTTETTTTDPATNQTTTSTSTTTIEPPTGTMGYGNVRITLRLAQAQLNQMGITEPTPEQLSAVLLGGGINGTQVDGILAMRADGMGWGQIAQKYGMTVGQIMGKGVGLSNQTATSAQPKASRTSTSGTASSAKSSASSQVRANGYIPSGKPAGSGIVTGMGGSANASGNGGGKGQTIKASAQGKGAMSAGGQHVSGAGAANATGGASASAPGQLKKN